MIRPILLLALTTTPALTDTTRPQALQVLLDYHAAACTAQGGNLFVPDDAVTEARLRGTGDAAAILDSARLSCSTAPGMFCADIIGCELNVFVGEAQHSLIVQGWSLVPEGNDQLLQVTIAGALLNKPEPGTFLMTWDETRKSLIEINQDK